MWQTTFGSVLPTGGDGSGFCAFYPVRPSGNWLLNWLLDALLVKSRDARDTGQSDRLLGRGPDIKLLGSVPKNQLTHFRSAV
jgi:hypothetical protein